MAGGYIHPQRQPLSAQKDCITVAKKKSDPFDYLRRALLKLFFINGSEEEDQWFGLYALLCFPQASELLCLAVSFSALPDGQQFVASHKNFKT